MIEFDKKNYPGRVEHNKFKKDRKVKTIKFDQLTVSGNTVEVPTTGLLKCTFYVKVTGAGVLEFQGSALGGVDDDDWVNIDKENRLFNHNDNNEGYIFEGYANFIRVRATGVTGTVDITLILGE